MRISSNDAIRMDKSVHGSNEVAKEIQTKQEKSGLISTADDKVEISSRSKDSQRIKEALAEAPEIRKNRVEEAKRALENGTLQLQGKDLAEKIISDALHNAL